MGSEQAGAPRTQAQHRALFDADGAALRFTAMSRPGAPLAASAQVPDGRTLAGAVQACVAQLPGWLVQTEDLGLAAALIKAGARPVRHAFAMQCDLRRAPEPQPAPPGLIAVPLTADCAVRTWAEVVPSWCAAYPPDHPDHFHGDHDAAAAALHQLVAGAELGPLHAASSLVLDGERRPVAGIIVAVTPFDPPWGGPWVLDVWRDPRLRGIGVGGWLLTSAQQRLLADGYVCLGLAVSAGNPARRSYQAVGFREVTETRTVQVPADENALTFPGQSCWSR